MLEFNFEDFLILKSCSVKDALKLLDKTGSKILFVVDEDKKLIGSLTDGDIRRWILKNGILDATVENVCNKNCLFTTKNKRESELLYEMEINDIFYAPILNEKRQVIDIYVRKQVSSNTIIIKRINLDIPVVIMAGGKGTRMAPFTTVLPKPLIPIGEKTVLEHIIDSFTKYGVNVFYFTINYRGEMIRAYFEGIKKNYLINYIKEPEYLGTAGSLALLSKDIGNTFIVSNCDIILKADYSDILNFHRETNATLTIISSIQHHLIPYGVIKFENDGIVKNIIEKPEYSFCINTGVYVLQKECLNYIKKNQIFHMTHLINELINNNKKVFTYPINESEYIDIGQWEEYRKAISLLTYL
jgi:dTDP-glucose pyrophosphorylase